MNDVSSAVPGSRETKYCNTIRMVMKYLGHATNAEILHDVQRIFPGVSATTIHRATARLASRGELQTAPPDKQGAMRYDITVKPHDHFVCVRCDMVRDIDIADEVIPIIESRLGGCGIAGNITIAGVCQACRPK